jgi:hypothetical protein
VKQANEHGDAAQAPPPRLRRDPSNKLRLWRGGIGALAAALSLVAGNTAAAPSVSALFGSRVAPIAHFHQPYEVLDFDGDGVPDQIYLVSIAAGSPAATIAKDVTVLAKPLKGEPLSNRAEPMALAIVLGKSGQKFLLTDAMDGTTHFFDQSPGSIWKQQPLPLAIAKKGSAQFKQFRKQEKQIAHDVVVLGTEAGIDIALYWTGKTFTVFWPEEEP